MKYKIKKAVDGSLLNRINALIPQQQMVRNIIEDIPNPNNPFVIEGPTILAKKVVKKKSS